MPAAPVHDARARATERRDSDGRCTRTCSAQGERTHQGMHRLWCRLCATPKVFSTRSSIGAPRRRNIAPIAAARRPTRLRQGGRHRVCSFTASGGSPLHASAIASRISSIAVSIATRRSRGRFAALTEQSNRITFIGQESLYAHTIRATGMRHIGEYRIVRFQRRVRTVSADHPAADRSDAAGSTASARAGSWRTRRRPGRRERHRGTDRCGSRVFRRRPGRVQRGREHCRRSRTADEPRQLRRLPCVPGGRRLEPAGESPGGDVRGERRHDALVHLGARPGARSAIRAESGRHARRRRP